MSRSREASAIVDAVGAVLQRVQANRTAPVGKRAHDDDQKILFPVDFSPSCVAMAPFVKRAAASVTSAKVTLLHVLEPSASGFELLCAPVARD